jgi:hypothetical protein
MYNIDDKSPSDRAKKLVSGNTTNMEKLGQEWEDDIHQNLTDPLSVRAQKAGVASLENQHGNKFGSELKGEAA